MEFLPVRDWFKLGDDERYKRCYNYSDKTVVKGDCIRTCVVNRAVAFEFFW